MRHCLGRLAAVALAARRLAAVALAARRLAAAVVIVLLRTPPREVVSPLADAVLARAEALVVEEPRDRVVHAIVVAVRLRTASAARPAVVALIARPPKFNPIKWWVYEISCATTAAAAAAAAAAPDRPRAKGAVN